MMKPYTSYNAETGEILCNFDGTPADAELNAPYVEGEYDPEQYTIANGKPKKKPTKEIKAKQAERDWERFKQTRNGLLKDSDWTQVGDAPVDSKAWAKYRQELRDLPTKVKDPSPDKIKWPKPPKPDNKDKA